MASPTERSLGLLRREGWIPGVVERHNTFSRKKHDYVGVIDIIAIRPGPQFSRGRTLGVQACAGSGGDSAARVAKALAEWRMLAWLLAGNEFEVWSWAKRTRGIRGGRKLWTVRRVGVRLSQPGVRTALIHSVMRAWSSEVKATREASALAFPRPEWEGHFQQRLGDEGLPLSYPPPPAA